ncbi:cadmium-translocating P-type ATPase [Parashewanella curva]|uniref:P-type Cu(2+) transporter n=1 Tax=Parashewanella curva TaxID=2338552 RepID=A0A3L8PUA9_9GAMM|nr:heavy metal translocating P-type ATPase metal-binding domain-containing protein [Parashewanella curva]RLV58183.1 cadmium-translocating P-type ATPase [Parashewanella curva]
MSQDKQCYHCGESVPASVVLTTVINEQAQPMCCIGCQAVSQAIMDAGLKNYYKFRTEPGTKQSELVPDELNSFSAYDLDEVQKDFVHSDTADIQTVSLSIDGITCAACAWLIEHKLKQLKGLQKVMVNSTTQRALISWDKNQLKLSEILQQISAIGYVAAPYQVDEQEAKAKKSSKQFLLRLGLAGFSTMQVMMFALALYTGYFTDLDTEFRDYFRWVSMIFAAPVALYSAQPFYFSAVRSLLSGRINMDVPVSIAIGGAFIASCFATYHGVGEVYFESVSMFTFFLLLGRYFEQKAKQKASVSSSNLHKLVPLTATLVVESDYKEVAAKQLKIGDVILVKPGEVIAADGIIAEGKSSLNESMLTGEHLPLTKSKDQQVFAGTINVEQPVKVRVNAIGNEQFVSEIIRLQELASNNRPSIALIVDKLSRYFSAAVLSLSLITYLVWHFFISPEDAFWVTLSVLVATCPCALALATPTAVTCATAMFTKLGIITRKSGVFETLPKIKHVVFDKTGTLTYGRLQISDVKIYSKCLNKQTVLKIIAALEQGSEHPIAKVFREYLDTCNFAISDVEHHVGKGISGVINSENYFVGKAHASKNSASTEQTISLLKEDELVAEVTLSDEIRNDALSSIQQMQKLNLHLAIASGDQSGHVQAVASKLGINDVHFDLTPSDKLDLVKRLQAEKHKVVMFGDGINDAPVLSGADLSVAMGSGTAIAKNSADLILLGDKLTRFVDAINVATRTTKIIKQNLMWALGYNLVVLPLAMSGNIAPYVAAIGMSASSLIVVSNSLRLLKDAK